MPRERSLSLIGALSYIPRDHLGQHCARWQPDTPPGRRKISLAIVNNAYAAYLAGPTQVTLTTSWQRFRINRMLAAGQTGLWTIVRQYASSGDDWTTGDIHLWGACLQQGNDPQATNARTWSSQTQLLASGFAAGPTFIAAPDSTTSSLKVYGPGSNLAERPSSNSPPTTNSSSGAAPAIAIGSPNSGSPTLPPAGLERSKLQRRLVWL